MSWPLARRRAPRSGPGRRLWSSSMIRADTLVGPLVFDRLPVLVATHRGVFPHHRAPERGRLLARMPPVPLVRVIRSGLEESVHAGDVAVVDPDGRLVAFAGEPDRLLFARSCMKPLQATVSLSLAPFDFPDREVAVMCASH